MFKKINFLFVGIIAVCLFNTDAFCMWKKYKIDDLEYWFKDVEYQACKDFDVGTDKPCIGESKNKCTSRSVLNKSYRDEYGVLVMLATDVSEGGAYFCPVMILGRNEDRGSSWTTYHSVGEDCVWLCQDGYSGEKCLENNNTNITFCDNTRLIQSNYDSVKRVGSSDSENIEGPIPNWGSGYYRSCDLGGSNQEHDTVLAISNWTISGYGAWVKPYVVHAAKDEYTHPTSWITLFPAKTSTETPKLVCKSGFKRNATNTDCEPIDNSVCAVKLWCAGWDESNFDSNKFYEKKMGDCLQWRCKENGYALNRVGSDKCEFCGISLLDGVNPETGACIRCEEGYVFLASAKDTGYCAKAKALDKNIMMYGNSTNQSSPIDEQCWAKTKQDDYVNCVFPK